MAIKIITGDCRDVLRLMPAESTHCCVTSPPYFGLRDYGVAGQIGLEPTPAEYVAEMVDVFREVRRVLRDDGTLWLNLGDSYASAWACNRRNVVGSGSLEKGKRADRPNRLVEGLKEKDLIGIPWRVAFALQADGWWLRSSIIWHKPNPMPESVTDRPTSAHENLFLLAKSERYYFDADVVREPNSDWSEKALEGRWTRKTRNASPDRNDGMGEGNDSAGSNYASKVNPLGRNIRNVWTVPTAPYSEAHFATFPPALIEPCIKAGCPSGGMILDPFGGAGTTGLVADRLGRSATLIELNPAYAEMARGRLASDAGMFGDIDAAAHAV